jgi:hypothetical protein
MCAQSSGSHTTTLTKAWIHAPIASSTCHHMLVSHQHCPPIILVTFGLSQRLQKVNFKP